MGFVRSRWPADAGLVAEALTDAFMSIRLPLPPPYGARGLCLLVALGASSSVG